MHAGSERNVMPVTRSTAGGAVDGQGVAVAGKRPAGDLHGGEVEHGVVHVGEARLMAKAIPGTSSK